MMFKNRITPVVLFLHCVLSTLSVSVYAQELSVSGKQVLIKSRPVSIRQDSAWISLDIEISKLSVGSERQLILTPMLQANNNNKALPPVIINGKKRHKIFNRSLKFSKKNEQPPYRVIQINRDNASEIIHYSVGVHVEPWMKAASLVLEQDLCGCGNDQQQISVEMIAQRFIYVSKPVFNFDYADMAISFVEPPKEDIKKRTESDHAYVIFEQGKSVILPGLSNNQEELNKITRSLDYLKNELSAQINHIRISAHASPEGSQISNRNLSANRAKSLVNWLESTRSLGGVRVDSWGEGEGWATLLELIRADAYLAKEDKQYLERIIGDVTDQDARERQIMRYKSGELHRYLSASLYPKLRRCDYRIEFTVPEFSLEKSLELLKKRPAMLSLAEFYAIANTYSKGDRQFNQLFDIAVRLFPQDAIANLNAAAAELNAGELDKAAQRLNTLKDNPHAWNNIGVLLMKKHEVDEAEKFLKRAVEAGSTDAKINMQLIPKLRQELERYNNAVKEYNTYLIEDK